MSITCFTRCFLDLGFYSMRNIIRIIFQGQIWKSLSWKPLDNILAIKWTKYSYRILWHKIFFYFFIFNTLGLDSHVPSKGVDFLVATHYTPKIGPLFDKMFSLMELEHWFTSRLPCSTMIPVTMNFFIKIVLELDFLLVMNIARIWIHGSNLKIYIHGIIGN